MNTDYFQTTIKLKATRAIGQANINARSLAEYELPLPSLDMQKQIVAQIEQEQKRVQATKELVEIFEQKINDKIAEVWGEELHEEQGQNASSNGTHKKVQPVQRAVIEQAELGLG